MKNRKTIAINSVLNVMKTCITIAAPLITYPYVSHILTVSDLGKISFSSSIISYFTLLAALGIPTYAIREGVLLKRNKKSQDRFISEMFTLNIICTALSLGLLFLISFFVSPINTYGKILFIQSFTIVFTTVGIDWVNNMDEDFLFITVRTIVIHIVSIGCVFLFVKSKNDYLIYAAIHSMVIVLSGVWNFFYIRRKHNIYLVLPDVKKHLVPVCIIFFNTVAITIYCNSDSTMLGLICGDYETGIYNLSTKIYSILKTLFSAVFVAVLPEVTAYYSGNERNKVFGIIKQVYGTLLVMIFPVIVGGIVLRKDIVYIIGGEKYFESCLPFAILMFALLFAMLANLLSSLVYIPRRKEKVVLFSTLIGAGINIILNFAVLPYFKSTGAAITTWIAEMIVFMILFAKFDNKRMFCMDYIELLKVILANVGMIVWIFAVRNRMDNYILQMLIILMGSIIIYFAALFLMREELICIAILKLKTKFRKE